tara:strand:- start:426 stop:1151 length:726 start_codon:yes stop_codon:yes gene_type:complete
MNNVPIYVDRLILEFLYFSKDLKNIFFINKYWNELIKKSNFLITYFRLRDNMRMYLEDERMNNFDFLKNKWEKYNSWKWKINHENVIKINQYVDVLDKVNVWCPGIIKNIIIFPNFNETTFEKKMKIQFLGWNDGFDETVSIKKIKPFGSKTINPSNKYESLKKIQEGCWVLYKYPSNQNYIYVKLKTIEVNEKNIIVEIERSLVKITKENIDFLIKTPTNANALIFKSKDYELFNRKLKF